MKIGIVGCGLIGQKRAVAARERGAEIVGFTDVNPALAQGLAGRFDSRAYADLDGLIAAGPDVVIIATVHDALAPLALRAVEAGKHVLVEKPAGQERGEVQAVAAAAKASNRVVKVGFNYRFHPAMLKAKEVLESGALGPMMMVRARHGHGGRVGYEKEWRCDPARSGGGEMIDQGSHLIDLSRWYMGELSLKFACTPTSFWDVPVEDNCFLAFETEGGQMAWLHASWTEWKNIFSFEIFGRDGKLMIDGMGGSYGVEKLTHYRMLPEMGPPETTSWEYPGPDLSWHREFDELAAAISEGRRPVGDITDAAALWTLIEAAYEFNGPRGAKSGVAA
jgi:predicted dehydrogenase